MGDYENGLVIGGFFCLFIFALAGSTSSNSVNWQTTTTFTLENGTVLHNCDMFDFRYNCGAIIENCVESNTIYTCQKNVKITKEIKNKCG